MLIGFDELPPDLRDYISALRNCVRAALEEFSTNYSSLRAKLSPRSEASVIHDLMVFNAKAAKGTVPGLGWKLKKNLFLISIGPDYRVKPKRLYGRWRPKNITTDLVLDFERQRPLLLFDNLDPTHLFLGYKRDDAEILNSTIWLVCPEGKRVKWVLELTGDSSTMGLAIPEPTPVDEPTTGRIRRRPAPTVDDDKKAEGE